MVQIHPSLPSPILVVVVLGLKAVERGLQACIGGLFAGKDRRTLILKAGHLDLAGLCLSGLVGRCMLEGGDHRIEVDCGGCSGL